MGIISRNRVFLVAGIKIFTVVIMNHWLEFTFTCFTGHIRLGNLFNQFAICVNYTSTADVLFIFKAELKCTAEEESALIERRDVDK
jgi:hypothetical protein